MILDNYSALFDVDIIGFHFNIKRASESDVFRIGQGYENPRETAASKPRAASSRLRFGMSDFVEQQQQKRTKAIPAEEKDQPQQKQRHRKVHLFGSESLAVNNANPSEGAEPASSSGGQASSSSSGPQQPLDQNQDQDLYPLNLSEAASREFAAASRAAESGAIDESGDGDGNDDITSSHPPISEPERKTKSFFHKSLGILGVGYARRAGVKCFHCDGSIEKNQIRFDYAYHLRKPSRCIHPGCLVQMNADARTNSVKILDTLLRGRTLDAEERACCQEAAAILRET